MSTATIGKRKYDLDNPIQREDYWTTLAADQLVGRTIKKVSYLSTKEAQQIGWSERPLVITLDDGNQIIPSRDDEGNGGGALFTNDAKNGVLPVLY